jgi:ubiquinone/menaquinone biosynthesis C-methylase UbiE
MPVNHASDDLNKYMDKPKKVIDIGCGIGKSTLELSKKIQSHDNIEIIGVDKNEINILKANYNFPSYDFYIDDIINSKLPSHEFDILHIKDVFQEIDPKDFKKVMDHLKRISKPKGSILYINHNLDPISFKNRDNDNLEKNINLFNDNFLIIKSSLIYDENKFEIIAKT